MLWETTACTDVSSYCVSVDEEVLHGDNIRVKVEQHSLTPKLVITLVDPLEDSVSIVF